MKERPILFNGDMVRAILEGRKTQTRRIVKPAPQMVTDRTIQPWEGDPKTLLRQLERNKRGCPYGQPGDRLWVRETWSHTGTGVWQVKDATLALDGEVIYGADKDPLGVGWFPSIHMPRWASRIILEITGVRVERLQEISEADAWNEGVQDWMGKETPWKGELAPMSVHGFASLWESINGPDSWVTNPWVWVVEFKRVEQ